MSGKPQRVYLGSMLGVAERMRVFRTPDALEVDSSDHYEIQRRRVFWDEVLLVTLHRGLGGGVYPWVLGILTLFTGFFAAVMSATPELSEVGTGFLIATAVLAVLAVASGFLPAWTVTVYGRRTRARMRYRFREGKARAIYAEICAAAGEAQQTLATRQPPPPQPPLLPSSPVL
jgi:hypothetical protein